MGNRRNFLLQMLGVTATVAAATPGWAGTFVSPVNETAMLSRLAAQRPMLALASAGQRFVAVGLRGLIVLSDDGGRTWRQAAVPVSSDLVAVCFPTAISGWAVGHGGVILHSGDGGATWVKQLDGRQAAQIAMDYYGKRAAADPAMDDFLAGERSLADGGGTQSFLGVYFEDERVGYVVGTFNRIFRTDDGGRTWEPWMDRTSNPTGLHFNAIAGREGVIFMAGEQGTVWRLDPTTKRFVALSTGYKGTFFGLVPISTSTLLAFGMRGSVFRSADAGATWARIAVSSPAGVTCGALLANGAAVLVTQVGVMEISHDQGRSFVPLKPALPMEYYAVSPGAGGQVVVAGAEGVRLETIR